MLSRTIAIVAALGFSVALAGPAPAGPLSITPFEQCLEDYCFGNYGGNPDGYKLCWQWCADQTGGPQLAPLAFSELPGKVD